jgi:hypothetical protein
MPNHVHLVIGVPSFEVERLDIQIKGDATQQLIHEGVHPFGHVPYKNGRPPKCFARGEWKVFLDPPDLPPAIEYVENNPEKDGLPRQNWSFVQKLD